MLKLIRIKGKEYFASRITRIDMKEGIVKLCGDVPRIELFARQSAEGWDCWGLEAPDDKKHITGI